MATDAPGHLVAYTVPSKTFCVLVEMFRFPLRFLGSKTSIILHQQLLGEPASKKALFFSILF